MTIELTEVQRAALQQLLHASLGDLSTEIADTDNPSYRKDLRERREVLQSVLTLLDGTSPA